VLAFLPSRARTRWPARGPEELGKNRSPYGIEWTLGGPEVGGRPPAAVHDGKGT